MKKEILVLGDSHAGIFKNESLQKLLPEYEWTIVQVFGATLSGLSNPNSKTRTTKKFNKALTETKAGIIVTLLGEVDCGFVIWYYVQRDQIDVYEAAGKAIENYKNLLLESSQKAKTFVISAPLPTIADGQTHGSVAQERSKITATQRERTDLTVWFNKKIEEFCQQIDTIEFINLDSLSTGEDGLVSTKLIRQNKADHHYKVSEYVKLLKEFFLVKLDSIIYKRQNYIMTSHDIDLLRDTALFLEDKDLKKAYELMNIANQLRPTGVFIKKKLDEYKKKNSFVKNND